MLHCYVGPQALEATLHHIPTASPVSIVRTQTHVRLTQNAVPDRHPGSPENYESHHTSNESPTRRSTSRVDRPQALKTSDTLPLEPEDQSLTLPPQLVGFHLSTPPNPLFHAHAFLLFG